MAVGKPLRKDFYSDSESGQRDIDMPQLNQEPPIKAAAPNPWDLQPSSGNGATAPVPDSIPRDVLEEMNCTQDVCSSNEYNTSTVEDNLSAVRDDLSQTEEDDEIEEVVPQVKKGQESPAAKRIRELREAQKKAERERDELLRMMQMQQMQQQMPKQQAPIEPEDEDINIEDDALIEGKQFRQMYKEMKQMKKQLHSYQAQSAESITEAKIKASYPDFDKVVSQENIAMLRDQYPEIANTLSASTDLYSKAVSAYTMIKQFGIHQDPVIQNDYMRVMKNTAKPRPLTSVNPQQGNSPLTKANAFANGEFTEDDKKRAWAEMVAARKNG
jgi:hypothetical protein